MSTRDRGPPAAAASAASAQYSRQPGAEPVACRRRCQGVGLDQRLNQPCADLPFRDESGQTVTRRLFRRQPIILVMAYYRCPMLCTQVLKRAGRLPAEGAVRLGDDYRVVTVSFDARRRRRWRREEGTLPGTHRPAHA